MPSLIWELVRRLRDAWPGLFLPKGILHLADGEEALRIGTDGVVVSNHSGR